MRAGRVLMALALIGLLALGAAWVATEIKRLDEPLNVSAPVRFKVPPGSRFARVATDLSQRGIIAEPRMWALYARWKGVASSIKAGEYEIEPGATPRSLLSKMVNGQVLLHSFTIVDGWRVQDMLGRNEKEPRYHGNTARCTERLAGRLDGQTRVHPAPMPKDSSCPRHIGFRAGPPTSNCSSRRTRLWCASWSRPGRAAILSVPLRNADELLIVASIVQKESGVPQELPKIAGLYLHRLRIGMRLQADPTVIYGLGERYDGTLHTVDLHEDGPYNTYTRAGLPPTPIALAGAAAIDAAAHPEATEALYFVASPKDDGSHVFSATLEAQNAAVARYVAHLREKRATEDSN